MANDELTVRGRVAVAGVGESIYYRRGQSPDAEFILVIGPSWPPARTPASTPARSTATARTPTTATCRPASTPRSAPRDPLLEHAVGRRGRGRRRRGGQRRRRRGRRLRRLRRRLPGTRPGPVRPLRRRPAAGARSRGDFAFTAPYGPDVAGPDVRHARRPGCSTSTASAPTRSEGGVPRRLPPRPEQPPGGDARPAPDRRGLRRGPLDHRAVPALRLLPGERRRRGHDRHVGRAGPGPHRPARLRARRPAGRPFRSAASVHNVPDYASSSFKLSAPRLYAQAGVDAGRRRRRPVLRELHRRRGDEPHRARLLQLRGGQRVPHLRQPDRPGGRLPLNTSGGNLAECYMHGLGLVIEAARQVRGDSTNQVPDAKVSFVNAGPMVDIPSAADLRDRGGAGLMADAPASYVLPEGLPAPVPAGDGLDARYWEGTRATSCGCSAARTAAPGSGAPSGSATAATAWRSAGSRWPPRASSTPGSGPGTRCTGRCPTPAPT